jgi:hypothetical protein
VPRHWMLRSPISFCLHRRGRRLVRCGRGPSVVLGRRREPFVAKCGWHPFRGERRRGDVGSDALTTRCCGIAMNPNGMANLLIASH